MVKKKKLSDLKKKIFIIFFTFLSLLLIYLIVDLSYWAFFVDVKHLQNQNPSTTAFIQYRQKQYARKHKKVRIRQYWVSLSKVSPNLKTCVVRIEDAKFWKHEGFDFDAIQKAVETNIEKKKFKLGASTITQQLSKNLFLSPRKTPLRKVREAILTYRLEKALKKRRILELYLNVAEWGEGIFGIEAASLHYYKKHASELTLDESIALTAVLPNPIKYSPIKSSKFLTRRTKLIKRKIYNPKN